MTDEEKIRKALILLRENEMTEEEFVEDMLRRIEVLTSRSDLDLALDVIESTWIGKFHSFSPGKLLWLIPFSVGTVVVVFILLISLGVI